MIALTLLQMPGLTQERAEEIAARIKDFLEEYNRTAGFVFLVDSEEGWSWVKPLTGAPQQRM